MNRTYRSIWNEALGAWVATSEISGRQGKGSARAGMGIALLLLATGLAHGQTKIGDNPTVINPGSMLEVESTNRGVSMPRVALTDRATWTLNGNQPVDGMMVYNTNATTGVDGLQAGMAVWKGGQWVSVDETPYLHVNSTVVGNSTLSNSGATGAESIAIGGGAVASGNNAIAMSAGSQASGVASLALGTNAQATGREDIAIGLRARAQSGADALNPNLGAIAIGGGKAAAIGAIAIGNGWADGPQATNTDAIAIGTASNASGFHAAAFGRNTVASGENSLALGNEADALGIETTAIGNAAAAGGNESIAAGARATAADLGTAVGVGSTAAYNSVAVGRLANAHEMSVSVGQGSATTDIFATAVGFNARAEGYGATALGYLSKATAGGSLALGVNATVAAGLDGAVSLGSNSVVTAATPTASNVINGRTFTYAAAGAAPAAGDVVSVGTATAPRQIQNVANGQVTATSLDAVNGSQLYSVADQLNTTITANKTKYYHVNSTGGGNEANDGATGVDAIASGKNAVASGDNSYAAGLGATAGTLNSVAIGVNATASNGGQVAIGSGAQSLAQNTIAIGGRASVRLGIAIGFASNSAGNGAITIGDASSSTGAYNVALGMIAKATGDAYSTALGYNAAASQRSATAVGVNSVASAYRATALGRQTTASGESSLAAGSGATASALNSVAQGFEANASVEGGVALGSGAVSDRAIAGTQGDIPAGSSLIHYNTTDRALLGAVSVGNTTSYRQITNVADGTQQQDAVTVRQLSGALQSFAVTPTMYFHANSSAIDSLAVGMDSVAIGPQTVVNGNNGIGMGNGATVQASAPGGIAIGQASTSGAADAVALGTQASANAVQGVALGAGSNVTQAGGVALGAGSVASTAAGVAGYIPPTATAEQRTAIGATTSTLAAVSVGDAASGQFRQITGVAAGTVDSDAVNVSQLKAVQGQVTQIDQGTVKYDTKNDGAVDYNSVTMGGSNTTGPVTVHNVAEGVAGTDAVNVNQLNAGLEGGKQYTDQRFNQLSGDLRKTAKQASAGTASAIAMANLPQAYIPGKSMVSVGVGGYDGEAGIALGVSKLSDNGRWVVKFSATGNSRSKFGVGAGAGFHW